MIERTLKILVRVAGLALAITVQVAWVSQPLSFVLRILPLAVLGLTAWRPGDGLLVMAGLGPIAGAVSLLFHSPLPGARLLEQLVLAVIVGATLRLWRSPVSLRLAGPALLLSAIAIASAIAAEPALLLRQSPGASLWTYAHDLFDGVYFQRTPAWEPLFFAALTVEGAALAVIVERIVRLDAGTARRAIFASVIGQSATALLNLNRLVESALRTGNAMQALPGLLAGTRVNVFYDLNAAGSIFLLTLVVSVGLVAESRWIRWMLPVTATALLVGLWLSGSRSAMLAFAVTAVVMLALEAWRRRGVVRWVAAATVALLLMAGSWTVVKYPAARNLSIARSTSTRQVMARVSLNMWRSAPVFGIGIGRFYDESARFGADALASIPGFIITQENAHNNFLQVLADEGLVGLAALILLLGAGLIPAIRTEIESPTVFRRWVIAAVAAYLLTWLTGHPQLVPESAFSFWMLFGILAALTSRPLPAKMRVALAVASAAVLLTAAPRLDRSIRAAELEHIAIGLSAHWQPELDGVRYRQGGQTFSLYLPADGSSVDLPLRRAPNAPDPLVVTIRSGGRTLYDVLVGGEEWQRVRLQLPRAGRRFALAEFTVSSLAARPLPSPLIYVGKAEPR